MESLVPASQASSHFALDPIPASVLADKEARRRDAAVELGYCLTGCAVLDDDVLLGGFERGSVVGVSAEDEEMGLGLQTLAHSLCDGRIAKGLVVTPKPRNVTLARLRDAVKAELKSQGVGGDAAKTKLRECLERVMLSCVFDLDGLWEVLADLNKPAEEEVEEEEGQVEEIQDSQDDDDEALSPVDNVQPPKQQTTQPGIIVVTHFSSLLTGVFTHRERSAAHSVMESLGSHLRDLSRNLSSSPLIMLLNSTSSSSGPPTAQPKNTPLDATLRSIFHTAPIGQGPQSTRRIKPNYGIVFSQLLDLHLLCTRIPRTMQDAEAAVQRLGEEVRMVWVVEVLQDEIGVWNGTRGDRKVREQLWTALDVEQARVKPAFG
ncbi:uncharacterized protein NECHADRAFT_35701 [Fusarium vanettenii 77-13-4]|uniref:Uncharacterized protein n=1 Tax=Fusarium vanettenii (strain ATCC MYA-4622 / CBS 123669 / FGSC 9596 / NRRL 45880 / 77-13-4) TaxID=660122 RepID=C7YLW4_FUSV7|nr:uncharacterized protein NECHADRAFT_35701 [Fusarium vanettenii 77-13-4]EEU47343.1 hypothetical protein NECHADRAFT_35701 [Fusarium vanettenii 77-13-4]